MSTGGVAAAVPPVPLDDLLAGPVPAVPINPACTGTTSGTTYTLTADCDTTQTLGGPGRRHA